MGLRLEYMQLHYFSNRFSFLQFTKVTEHLQSSNKTVGDLAQALMDYYRSVSDGAVAQTLFTRLLQI